MAFADTLDLSESAESQGYIVIPYPVMSHDQQHQDIIVKRLVNIV